MSERFADCELNLFEAGSPACLGLEVGDKRFDDVVFFAVAGGQFWLIVSPTTDVYNRRVVTPAAEKIAERVRETRYVLIGKENVIGRGLGKCLLIFVNDIRFAEYCRKRFASCPLLSSCLCVVFFSPHSSLTDFLL